MAHGKSQPMKAPKDVGEVVHPIEKLMAARAAGASCVHIEADLELGAGLTKQLKDRTRAIPRGIIETE